MAITTTATFTSVFTRMELIKLQVERVLTRSGLPEASISKILQGVDERLISEISVYGLDDQGDCHAELIVKIDWARNTMHMTAGRDTVRVDVGWQGGISTEIDLALGKFELFVREIGLKKVVHTRYGPGVDREAANRRLGFRAVAPVRWRGGTIGTVMGVPELDEVSVGLNVTG